jgi:hypothetical protein
VNCSIGDVLTDAELAAEARTAETPVSEAGAGRAGQETSSRARGADLAAESETAAGDGGVARRRRVAAALNAPRGFDRYLSAGFTPAEVNQLRLQFASIQATRYTRDTMPSPDTMRSMEDAWIDNNAGLPGAGGGGGGGPGAGDEGTSGPGDDAVGVSGLLDVLVKGMVIGFMWPLGTVGWLIREEALLSRRSQVFAFFGFILSLTIGTIRALSGER